MLHGVERHCTERWVSTGKGTTRTAGFCSLSLPLSLSPDFVAKQQGRSLVFGHPTNEPLILFFAQSLQYRLRRSFGRGGWWPPGATPKVPELAFFRSGELQPWCTHKADTVQQLIVRKGNKSAFIDGDCHTGALNGVTHVAGPPEVCRARRRHNYLHVEAVRNGWPQTSGKPQGTHKGGSGPSPPERDIRGEIAAEERQVPSLQRGVGTSVVENDGGYL